MCTQHARKQGTTLADWLYQTWTVGGSTGAQLIQWGAIATALGIALLVPFSVLRLWRAAAADRTTAAWIAGAVGLALLARFMAPSAKADLYFRLSDAWVPLERASSKYSLTTVAIVRLLFDRGASFDTLVFLRAHELLGQDAWLVKNEAERLERLRRLGEG